MKTEILKIDQNHIELDKIRYAAEIFKAGGLVAFPTETVYGLGANALSEAAVGKIFKAKGRPADNPLIVHIAELEALRELVTEVPARVPILADKFWPGPLTMLMQKSLILSDLVTAGLKTVGIRMPSHPIARALIREAALPIAAPSANTSGKPSPTEAAHVIEDLSGKVDLIIDGGCAQVGLESTVLDVTEEPAVILRPGGITAEQLKAVLGDVSIDPALSGQGSAEFTPRAPGMKYTHYSPEADVIIIEGKLDNVAAKINALTEEYQNQGIRVGVLATEQTRNLYTAANIISMGDRENPETIAASLFRALREFDQAGVQVIFAEAIGSEGIGLAVMNRMIKAAGYNILSV